MAAMGNKHNKFGGDQPCGFRVMRADGQTDILIAILCTPAGGEVIIAIYIHQPTCHYNTFIPFRPVPTLRQFRTSTSYIYNHVQIPIFEYRISSLVGVPSLRSGFSTAN